MNSRQRGEQMSETQFTWIDHQRYRIVRKVRVVEWAHGRRYEFYAVTVEAA